MSNLVYFILAMILAIGLDAWLMSRVRRDLAARGIDGTDPERTILVFGKYSPVLTWFRHVIWSKLSLYEGSDSQEEGTFVAKPHSIEWLIIVLAVVLFCWGILDLGASTRLPGNEAEVFQTLDWTLVNSLRYAHQFPLWNPYLLTGLPYVADPMLHAYNPVVTVPVLLFGVRAGFKLGVALSFLIAALGMWRLGAALGMSRPARIWVALLYAFAGQPVGRFFQGQYLFVLGFAWIPWIISSLVMIAETRRRRYIAQAVLFMALLFFSGNAYYPFYMLLSAGIFVLVMVVQRGQHRLRVAFDWSLFKIYALVAILVLGLIAIQLLPLAEFWPRMNKDINLEGSHTLQQIFLDYTSDDPARADAYELLPAREEFYAYFGLIPILSLSLLPLAWWKRPRSPSLPKSTGRLLVFFILLLLLVVGWISLEHVPWGDWLLRTNLVHQFRHLLRILIFGSFAVIILAGLALDTLWGLFGALSETKGSEPSLRIRRTLGIAGLILLGTFMLVGVVDVFRTNRSIVQSQDSYETAYAVMGWLRQHDSGDYYVRHNPNNGWHDAVIASNLRFIDVWYHFADIRDLSKASNTRVVQARPHYIVQSDQNELLDAPDAVLRAHVSEYNVFSLSNSLPMAFVVDQSCLQERDAPAPLGYDEVQPQVPFFPGPNDIEVIADGAENQTLVVLVTHYPGWQVEVDGQEQELHNVGGYLAVEAQPGVHKYAFAFRPSSFFIGLFVSLCSFGVTAYLLASDIRWGRAVRQQWAALRDGWARFRTALRNRWPKPDYLVPAVYRQGGFRPLESVELADETEVRLVIHPAEGALPGQAARQWLGSSAYLLRSLTMPTVLPMVLFVLALGVYLGTRLIRLEDWPIYFFTDEAVHTTLAADLVRDHLENYAGDFLPTFFENGGKYRLGFTVYLHVLPYLIFGKTVFVTRATSAIITLACAVAIGLALRNVFKLSYWWSGALFLSITPAWFLHSRTAFEYAIAITLYSLFLYFYLLYRTQTPRHLYKALIVGALAFYSYSPLQMVVLVSGGLLLLLDIRYHWQNRQVALRGIALLILLAVPYVRFLIAHPEANDVSMRALGSYWFLPISFVEKLKSFFLEYLRGLNPLYWFIPNEHDLNRHLMKGYGHILVATLPLFVAGVILTLRRIRSAEYRILLVALLAAPSGAALVALGITRALVMVVPVAMLTALGVDDLMNWLEKIRFSRAWLGAALFLLLASFNVFMLNDAVKNGPTWYQDYTLGGMQYGGRQLFRSVLDYSEEHPDRRVFVSPNWANGADVVARFFAPDPMPFQTDTIDSYLYQYLPLEDTMVFVMTPEEYGRAVSSGKFDQITIDLILPYPNGEPGFYFTRLHYIENIEQILDAERAQRSQLNEQAVEINGQIVQTHCSTLDMGDASTMFDSDPESVARTFEANPMVLELTFDEPLPLTGLSVVIGSARMQVTVLLYSSQDEEPIEVVATLAGDVSQPEGTISFDQAVDVRAMRLEFNDLGQGEPGHVHIWEITLQE
ncbi:MAG: DUF104 domain-containing protein [Anaerolineales bacterium]|nr:DUF104 domain-containing protein [Anaerolineales bacterium]